MFFYLLDVDLVNLLKITLLVEHYNMYSSEMQVTTLILFHAFKVVYNVHICS